MKTKKTRRSLLWGVLVAGFAGTLTMATHPVYAESVTSSAIVGSDGVPVQPFIWSEVAQSVTTAVTSVVTALIGGRLATDNFPSDRPTTVIIGVNSPAYAGLPERALD